MTWGRDAFSDICAAIQRQRFESLKTKLDLCCTFVNIARAEKKTGNPEAAKGHIAAAEKGYADAGRFLSDPQYDISPAEREALQTRLHELREALDRLWIDPYTDTAAA